MMMRPKKQKGFTLIELMIVITILAIISAIAYPSYTKYVLRGKRAEGRAALLDAAAREERYYSDTNQYANLATALINPSSENGHYNLSVALGASNQTFILTATPNFDDPECGQLTYQNTGAKGKSGTSSVADCWAR
jgi:type IV pilus assembly protein PilE